MIPLYWVSERHQITLRFFHLELIRQLDQKVTWVTVLFLFFLVSQEVQTYAYILENTMQCNTVLI